MWNVREHSSITSSKRWVGGVRKWQFLMIYSTVDHQRGGWVGLKKPKTWWRNTWMPPNQHYYNSSNPLKPRSLAHYFLCVWSRIQAQRPSCLHSRNKIQFLSNRIVPFCRLHTGHCWNCTRANAEQSRRAGQCHSGILSFIRRHHVVIFHAFSCSFRGCFGGLSSSPQWCVFTSFYLKNWWLDSALIKIFLMIPTS